MFEGNCFAMRQRERQVQDGVCHSQKVLDLMANTTQIRRVGHRRTLPASTIDSGLLRSVRHGHMMGPPINIIPSSDMAGSAGSPRSQSPSLGRRSLLRWFGALILPTTLAACANSTPPGQYRRSRSHITGMDHRDGAVGVKRVFTF